MRDLGRRPARARVRASRRPAIPARPSESAMPPTRARRPGRRTVVGSVHRRSGRSTAVGAAARSRSRIPPIPTTVSASPTHEPQDVARPVRGGRGARQVQAGHDPRRRAGPGRVDREVERELGRGRVDADLRQPALTTGPSSMPRSERRSSSSDAVAGRAVAEAQAVVAGRGRQEGRARDRSAGRRRRRRAPRRSCRGPGSAAAPTGCRSGS